MTDLIKKALIITIAFMSFKNANAQKEDKSKKYELVLLGGIIQPFLLQGGNYEVDFYSPKMVFNYSHGFSLDLESKTNNNYGRYKRSAFSFSHTL